MRMRKKKHREERLDACSNLILYNLQEYRNNLKEIFKNNNPLHIELGCGKGKFISELASNNPEINYLAFEKNKDVMILAVEKIKNLGLSNVKFFCGDAMVLKELETETKCERIYINFCDPLPNRGKRKQRLTHHRFLDIYSEIITDDGEIFFKTDNRPLFEFSLNSFAEYGLRLKNITLDLHNSGYEENIMTEYETLFSSQGLPIYRCEASFETFGKIEKRLYD